MGVCHFYKSRSCVILPMCNSIPNHNSFQVNLLLRMKIIPLQYSQSKIRYINTSIRLSREIQLLLSQLRIRSEELDSCIQVVVRHRLVIPAVLQQIPLIISNSSRAFYVDHTSKLSPSVRIILGQLVGVF